MWNPVLRSFARLSLLPAIKTRQIFCSSTVFDSIRDAQRAGTKVVDLETQEGTAGAAHNIAVNLKNVDNRFPTAETLGKDFFGITYAELPTVYIKATKNNTLVTVMDNKVCSPFFQVNIFQNNVITYTSCRLEGFKNAKKKTTIAGQTTGVAAGHRLVRRGIRTVRVQVKGIGPGRMTCVKGLTVAGVNVVSLTDHTALCELGPRPRKIRRI